MKLDPRIRRTRERLHGTLMALSLRHGYDQVTVQDILREAETSRSTFYAHFRDKDDLLLAGFQNSGPPLFTRRADAAGEGEAIGHFAHSLFSHIEANQALAKVFFGSSAAAIMMGHLRNLIVVEVRELLAARAPGATPGELLVQFVAGTTFSLVAWWVDHDFCYPAQQMGQTCERLILSGLSAGAAG